MKWPTLLLLCATCLATSGALVWTAVQPTTIAARGEGPVFAPSVAAEFAEPPLDRSRFRTGRTLLMEARLGHRSLPAARGSQTYLFIDVAAQTSRRAPLPAPLHLVIVLDRSGSMKGKRLLNALAAARSAIGRLRDGDLVSVVAYDTRAEVVAAPTPITASSRARLLARLARLRAAGDTCISCGIEAGMSLVGQRGGVVKHMLLLSDGQATTGVRDEDGFRRLAEACRRLATSITTIGVDVNYNERVLAALARDSNGRHFFVENPSALPAVFDREMESLSSTVASRAELTIDLAPGVVAERVFDRTSTASEGRVVVPLGAFAAADRKTVLVQLRVPAGPAGERPVAGVRLRYDDLARGEPGGCEGALAAELTDDDARLAPLDGLVSARLSSSETAETLEQANALYQSGHAGDARRILEERAGLLGARRREAQSRTPAGRGNDLDDSFTRQEKALGRAADGFAEPRAAPAAPAAVALDQGAAAVREQTGEAQVRASQKDAFDLAE